MVPVSAVACKAVPDHDCFAWFPRVGEVIIVDVGDLPVGVRDEFAGGGFGDAHTA